MADLPITSDQGATPVVLNDPTTVANVANVKAASTASVVGDNSLVVALSPNSPVPTGTNKIGVTGVAQGSTTSGQNGDLVQGAVTTAAPTYVTAQTSPLSLTTAGALRTDASATTQPVSGTVTANAGTGTFTVGQATGTNLHTVLDSGTLTSITNALPAGTNVIGHVITDSGSTTSVSNTVAENLTQVGGSSVVTGGASGLLAVAGPVASGGANADNPIKVGAVFNTTQPTVTNGEIVDSQATARGARIVATGIDPFSVVQGTAAATTAGWPVTDGNIAESTAAWTSATTVNTAVTMTVTGYTNMLVTLNQTSTITGGVVTFEVSDTVGFTNAYPVNAVMTNDPDFAPTYTLVASTNQAFFVNVRGAVAFRIRLSTVITGTGTVNVGIQASSLPGDPVIGGEVNAELFDAAGNALTSTTVGTKQSLDIGIAASADGAAALANQVFTTSFNFSLPTAGTETPAAFLKNPNASGKTLVIKRIHVNNIGQGNFQAFINIYSDPTTSANGTSQTATTTSIGSGATAVATPFSGPTASANGARLYSESIGSGNQSTINNPLNFDGLIRVAANHTLLITGEPNTNASNCAFTIIWQEV